MWQSGINLIRLLIITAFFLTACTKNSVTQSAIVRVSAPEADAAEPAIAATSDGVFAVWVEHGADKTADIFLQKFDVNGKPNGEKVRINPLAGQATAWRGDPPTIKIGVDKKIYVGWTARVDTPDGKSANDLFLSVSPDGGKTFAAPVKVNDDKIPAVHGMHALEVDKNNRVYLAWLDERYLQKDVSAMPEFRFEKIHEGKDHSKQQAAEPNREVYFAVSGDGGKSFSVNKKLAGNVCPCCKISLVSAPDGKLFAGWRQVVSDNFRHIAVTSSADGGEHFAAFSIVSDDQWQIAGCPVSGAAMAVNTANNLQVIWFTAGVAGAPGLYSAESQDGGKTFSERRQIAEGTITGTPSLAPENNNLFAVWQNEKDGKVQAILQTLPQSADSPQSGQISIPNAELPVIAALEDKIFMLYIVKQNNRREIWLTRNQ